MRRAAIVSLVLGAAGCQTELPADEDSAGAEPTGGSTGADAGSGGDSPGPDACADACLDQMTQEGIASCYACRCKDALDDWLPSVDEFQCANGEPIVTYHAELSDSDYTMEPAPPGAKQCANPAFLTGSCQQGSRLGRIVHGDALAYWICRDPYLDSDGTTMYHDVAVIGHNTRTGATCFWDDVDDSIHNGDAPPLDLMEATEAERTRSVEVFKYTDGTRCVTCHDHDPFIYTPYLQSTGWQSVAGSKGPYHLVSLSGAPRSTGVKHLVSPPAEACTTCHRIGSRNTCSLFAPNSLAVHKTSAHEAEVHAAAEPGSPHWPLAYWMPFPGQAVPEFADWEARFAGARDHVLACCDAPGVDTEACWWEPVPVEMEG